MAVTIMADAYPFDIFELFDRHMLEQTLGDDRDAVRAIPQRLAFVNRPFEQIAHRGHANRPRELFRDQRNRCAGRLADAKGEMARRTAHHHNKIPAPGGARIFHQILHQIAAELARGFKAEGGNLSRQRQVVVDGFWHVANPDATLGSYGDLAGGEHSIVTADAGEMADAELV